MPYLPHQKKVQPSNYFPRGLDPQHGAEEVLNEGRIPGITGKNFVQRSLTPANILYLQQTVGNQAVQRLLAAQRQANPHVSQPVRLGVANSVIQRYTSVSFDDKAWKQSDSREILVREDKAKGRTKDLYASETALSKAQAALESAGSFIRLTAVGEFPRFNLLKLEPKFVGPGSPQGQMFGYSEVPNFVNKAGNTVSQKPVQLSGPNMVMPSDCNKSARVIMGIVNNEPVNEAPPPNQNVEVPVGTAGPQQQVHQRKDLQNAKFGGKSATLVESGGLSALTQSMKDYRAVVPQRVAQDAQFFLEKTTPLLQAQLNNAEVLDSWKILYDIKEAKPQLYADFVKWVGIDAAIAPRVGDALVTYLPEVKTAEAITKNNKLFPALVKALKETLATKGNAELRVELNSVIGLATDVRTVQTGIVTARTLALQTKNQELDQARIENQEGKIGVLNTLIATLQQGKTDAQRLVALANEVLVLCQGLGQLLEQQNDDPAMRQTIAEKALGLLGIEADTPFAKAKRNLSAEFQREEPRLHDNITNKLDTAVNENNLWNKHWGGVIMTDGDDYVTLENDASTDSDDKMGKLNEGWGFALYGNKKKGQSFHEHMMAGGDFGNFASTTRYQRPGRVDNYVKPTTPQELLTNLSSEFWRKLNADIIDSRGDKRVLKTIFDKLTWQQRREIRKDYQNDLELMVVYEGQPPWGLMQTAIDVLGEYKS